MYKYVNDKLRFIPNLIEKNFLENSDCCSKVYFEGMRSHQISKHLTNNIFKCVCEFEFQVNQNISYGISLNCKNCDRTYAFRKHWMEEICIN